MEALTAILGLAMIYSWIHGVIILFKKTKDLTQYENVVLIVGLVAIGLYIAGTL